MKSLKKILIDFKKRPKDFQRNFSQFFVSGAVLIILVLMVVSLKDTFENSLIRGARQQTFGNRAKLVLNDFFQQSWAGLKKFSGNLNYLIFREIILKKESSPTQPPEEIKLPRAIEINP